MKLISLNLWCGIKYEALQAFLNLHAPEIDIFCFQEVRNGQYDKPEENTGERVNLFDDLKLILTDFNGYFTEMATGVGIASFVRKNIEIKEFKATQILSGQETSHLKMANGDSYYPRVAHSIILKDKNLIIHNFHGIPGEHKKDTPERELQTDRLLEMTSGNNPQIIVGDFNLDLHTQAIERLGDKMQNLIKIFDVKTTRNANYRPFESIPFADYAFLSPDIKINGFKALPDEVSDHLALFIDFE